jgi:two-component system sensor histidine kinase UhpB
MRFRGFPLQLFVFIIIPLTLLLLLVAFGSLFLHQRSMRTLVGERDERAVRAAASSITEQLNHRASAIRSLSLRVADIQDPVHVLADAAFLLPDFGGGIAFYGVDGVLLATSNDKLSWELTAVSTIAPVSLQEPQFSAPFIDPATGRQMVLIMASATGGETAVGAFYPSDLAQNALSTVFSANDQAAAFMVDENGTLLFQFGLIHPTNAELSGYDGTFTPNGERSSSYVNDAGEEYVIAYSPILPLQWSLVMKEPWQAVADPLLRATELAPLVLAPVLIIALIGLFFGLRQIVTPLQALEKQATALGRGDFEAIEAPVGGIHEIQRLQTELIHMARKVKVAQQSLRGYLGAITMGQEEERRRLARDLHDDTIQSLIALNQRVQLAQLADPEAVPLAEMQQMSEQTITNLRRLIRDLRPIYLEDLGLVTALNMLTRDSGEAMGIDVEFNQTGTERRLSPDVELAFYRIGQEAFNNIAHHANASHAQLSIAFTADTVTLTVEDDGQGFVVPESPAVMAAVGHFGLLGIQERVELIGAHVAIQSEMGVGTHLTIQYPLL